MNGTLAPTLSPADRCDRCGAQAYLRARLSGGLDLLFCAHHGRNHMEKLKSLEDVEIIDESHLLEADAAAAVQ